MAGDSFGLYTEGSGFWGFAMPIPPWTLQADSVGMVWNPYSRAKAVNQVLLPPGPHQCEKQVPFGLFVEASGNHFMHSRGPGRLL